MSSNILHVITGLGKGGAEGVLYRLVSHDTQNTHIVVSLTSSGHYGQLLNNKGIIFYALQINTFKGVLYFPFRFISILKKCKPCIVQTWMYHSDLIGGVFARVFTNARIFWGVRHTSLLPGESKASTRLVAFLCSLLSYSIPERIICCAQSSLECHVAYGYCKRKMIVIPNGFAIDTSLSSQNPSSSVVHIKRPLSTFIIGHAARFHPQKDHLSFLRAVQMLSQVNNISFSVVMCGANVDNSNVVLLDWIEQLGLSRSVSLLGIQEQMDIFYSSIDLFCLSSSSGEGFPNVLAEAMSYSKPCVATDVGDSSLIINTSGWLASTGSPESIFNCLLSAYHSYTNTCEWHKRCDLASDCVNQNYSLSAMSQSFLMAWGL